MKRKIILLGGKTYVISLPLEWVEKLGLKKKDELNVTSRGEELVISPEFTKNKDRIEIKIDNKNKKLIRNLFLILGSLGYDEVIVKFEDADILPFIHEIAQEYSEFTLIEQTENSCFFKVVSKEIKEEFDNLLDRCFKVTLSMARSFTNSIKESKYKQLKNLISLEKTNNKLSTLCQRILIKTGYREQDKTCFVYTLLWNLEIIADFYRRACIFLSDEKNPKIDKKTEELVELTNVLLEKLYDLSKNTTVNQFIEIFEKKEKIGQESEIIFKKGKYEELILTHYLLDISTYIQDCAVLYLGISSGENGNLEKNL